MIKRGTVEHGGIERLLAELSEPGFSGVVQIESVEGEAHLRIRDGRIIAARVHHDFRHNPFGRRSREGVSALREIDGWESLEYSFEAGESERDPAASA